MSTRFLLFLVLLTACATPPAAPAPVPWPMDGVVVYGRPWIGEPVARLQASWQALQAQRVTLVAQGRLLDRERRRDREERLRRRLDAQED